MPTVPAPTNQLLAHLVVPSPASPRTREAAPLSSPLLPTKASGRTAAARDSDFLLPKIDIELLAREDPAEVERLRVAAHDVGFWYAVNHGMSDEYLDGMRQHAHTFFNLPAHEKEQIHMKLSKNFRGYTRVGEEITLGEEDYKETLDFAPEGVACPTPVARTDYRILPGPNMWPEALGCVWKTAVLEYAQKMTRMGDVMRRGLALAMGKPASHFDEFFTEPFALLRMLRYPPQPNADGGKLKMGVGPHTDYGALTFIYQDDVGGLQVKGRDGLWHDAPPVPNSFIVNLGDTMQVWTKGYFLATPHRVIQPSSERSRLSIAFFYEPNLDAVVTPFDYDGGEVKEKLEDLVLNTDVFDYQTISPDETFVYGAHLLRAHRRNYPHLA